MNERRVFWLFLLLLGGQLILLTVQVPAPLEEGSLLEAAAVRSLAPVAFVVDWGADRASRLTEHLATRRQLHDEARRLRKRVEELERQIVETETLAAELRRLEVAMPELSSPPGDALRAEVVYAEHGSWLRTVVVRVGEGRPERDQPVVAPSGLVGRVVVASGPYAKVQLVTDRAAAVGALVERSRRQGIVRGNGEGGLVLDYVSRHGDIRTGDRLVTAGVDGLYPRGIPVGIVTEVAEPGSLFHRIAVESVVDLGSLERVYLMPRMRIPEELEGRLVEEDR